MTEIDWTQLRHMMITKDGMEGQIRNTLWETHGISRYNAKNNCIRIENNWYKG